MESQQILSTKLGRCLNYHQIVLTTAESCTGGGVSAAITDISGSSAWFDRAFITYSNEAKIEMLGVSPETINSHGAVSEMTVIEMVKGALKYSNANLGVSISGVAGPDGGSAEKPVGTVCLAWADDKGWLKVETHYLSGKRAEIRQQAVRLALQVLYEKVK